MKSFTLNLKTENAAFGESAEEACLEVARILRDAAKHIENGDDARRLMDSNGNNVGQYYFIE